MPGIKLYEAGDCGNVALLTNILRSILSDLKNIQPIIYKEDGRSKCRNAAISEAFHYMKIIEAWGTGLGRIRSSCAEYGLKEPAIEEFGDGFRVIFYRKVVNGISDNDENEATATTIDHNVSNEAENVVNAAQKAVNDFARYEALLVSAGTTKTYITSICSVYDHAGQEVFRQSDGMEYLDCSKSKAINVMNAMKQANVIKKVTGMGPGKYQFV